MARPKKALHEATLKRMAETQCTYYEMATYFNVGVNTLKRSFGRLIEEWRSKGKKTVREKLFQAAEKGDSRILVWMAEQHLDHRPVDTKTPLKNPEADEKAPAEKDSHTQRLPKLKDMKRDELQELCDSELQKAK